MAYLNDEAFDQGLDWVDTNGTRLDICSQESTTYAQATSTYTLGNATVNTGATVAAYARTGTSDAIAASTAITDAANGVCTVTFAAGTFDGLEGDYDLHVRVASGSDVQTVKTQTFRVSEALQA